MVSVQLFRRSGTWRRCESLLTVAPGLAGVPIAAPTLRRCLALGPVESVYVVSEEQRFLAVDIGNSRVKLGVFADARLIGRCDVATEEPASREAITKLLVSSALSQSEVESAAICSVVPAATGPWAEAVERALGRSPYTIGPHTDFGLTIIPQPPELVGRDRLVNAAAALERYGSPVIVVDIGTATTVDAVSKLGEFLGGAIAPGPTAMARALHSGTSQLPLVELDVPVRAIGRSTKEALLSGMAYGYRGLVRGLTEQIAEELASRDDGEDAVPSPRVVLTGGWSGFFFYDVSIHNPSLGLVLDEDLTLDGIRRVWGLNRDRTPNDPATLRPSDP